MQNKLIKSFSSLAIKKDEIKFYKENGYILFKNVFSLNKIDSLKEEMKKLINNQCKDQLKDIFKTDMAFHSRYFLDSSDKIRFFLENSAFDEKGEIKYPLIECVNKVGHGIHDANEKFSEFSYSNEIKHILKSFGYKKPSIVQSMYILKNKRIGGEVSPHTDNTYIRTNPLTCTGIWIPFDDATIENGALYGVPKSHQKKTDYFMKLIKDKNGIEKTVYNKDIKSTYNIEGAIPLEAKKGSVLVFDGDFVHFSFANYSDNDRHAYTLHCVETSNTIWEEDNWLQRPKNNPFKIINLV